MNSGAGYETSSSTSGGPDLTTITTGGTYLILSFTIVKSFHKILDRRMGRGRKLGTTKIGRLELAIKIDTIIVVG